jgi:hypothetical protein
MAVDVVGYSGLVGENYASAIACLLALLKSLVEPLIDRIPRPVVSDGRRRAPASQTLGVSTVAQALRIVGYRTFDGEKISGVLGEPLTCNVGRRPRW